MWTHNNDGATWQVRISATRVGARQEEGRSGEDRGQIDWKLSEVNTRAVSREQKELIDELKMAMVNVINIG